MKRTKFLLALLLALCLLGGAALAEEGAAWAYDNSNYYLKRVGELSGDVTIPSEVDGYAVNALAMNAFYEQHAITSLTMPDSLRALQSGAICYMDALTTVTLNDGLEYIGSNFQGCSALTSLTIPASVRMVDSIVSSCENLKEIRFEGACPLFLGSEWCFFMMPDDYTIYVPDDQLNAYAEALQDANGAAEHLKPSGKNAVIPEAENTEGWFYFDASTGTITGYSEYHAFVEFPESIGGVAVKAIGKEAFRSDYSIYGAILPEGLEAIETGAFQQACNLDFVHFPSTLKTIGDDAFFNAQIDTIEWNEGLEEIGARAFQYDHETILTLPSTVKTIGESAFESAQCQELYLGGAVETIAARAFARSSLNYMVFDLYAPIDIAPDAFVDTYLADLDLPWDCSFETRDAYAAMLAEQCPDCTVWINNPISGGVAEYPLNESSVTTIENGVWTAYHGDAADLTVWISYDDIDVTALGEGLFRGNQSIRSFYPHHCGWFTTIGDEAFADSSVEYVELFASITTIGDGAFRNCANITELTLPASLTSMGEGALNGCTGLTELTLPASLTSVGEGALDGCTGLTKLTVLCDPAILPEGLLADCSALTEIYAAPDATREQVQALSALVGRPWYDPVPRVGEQHTFTAMPYAPLPGDDFWFDEEYARLDAYQGYELNLILPREIDGVQLTMIGGGMMGRASYGDNYEIELPARSLVIPETYTEIPYYAFENCETLETVICYAPIEFLQDCTFKNCANLRQVVFVNGVRNLGMYVFDGCSSLETVYLGQYVENINEYAFLNEDGSVAYDWNACITDPALLPDVDALLAAVKSDPIPAPTPTPEPEPAKPIGEEGAAFFGTWYAETLEMEGMVFNAADMDMNMHLSLNADGTALMDDGESTDSAIWTFADGTAYIDGMALTLTEDGKLCMEEDGVRLIFAPGSQASVSLPDAPAATSEPVETVIALEDYIGTWHACYLVTGGMTGDPRSLFNLDITMVLNEDGTGTLTFPEPEEHLWYQDAASGAVFFGDGDDAADMPLTLLEGGFLQYGNSIGDGNALGGYIIFSQDENANWTPEFGNEPLVLGDALEDRLERKFVCVDADVNGYVVNASMLGGEYSMTFHADGTMDFVMAGTALAGLNWTQGIVQTETGEANAFIVDYYGSALEVVWTEEGFDMNFFDSMLMHFVPEA